MQVPKSLSRQKFINVEHFIGRHTLVPSTDRESIKAVIHQVNFLDLNNPWAYRQSQNMYSNNYQICNDVLNAFCLLAYTCVT